MRARPFLVLLSVVALGGCGDGESSAARDAESESAGQDTLRDASAAAEGAETPMTAPEAIQAHLEADRGPEQPIPFSHAFHASTLGLECAYCHTGIERSDVGSVPAMEICMGCHRTIGGQLQPIQEMRDLWARDESVPWNRVHRLPDFVQFSHQPHLRNGIECRECHGPVEEMHRVYRWSSLDMGWCLRCHRQEPREGDVATDYELAAEFPPPEIPREREEVGLYPTALSSGYATYRAPDDCATCHY